MVKYFNEFKNLPSWYKEIFDLILNAEFSGKNEIKRQVLSSKFKIIDVNGSMSILPSRKEKAPILKTIPVEAYAQDQDGIEIQVLLFTERRIVYMLEISRVDSERVIELPPANKFEVMVLGP